MPLYRYECAQCGHVMEMLEKSNATGPHVCEKCGSHRMEKTMPTFSVGAASGVSGSCCPTGTWFVGIGGELMGRGMGGGRGMGRGMRRGLGRGGSRPSVPCQSGGATGVKFATRT